MVVEILRFIDGVKFQSPPPSLEESTSYDAWLKEISIWQTFTDTDIKKQGLAVFLTLEGSRIRI